MNFLKLFFGRVLIQMDHYFSSKTYLEKNNNNNNKNVKKYAIVCALPETDDHINPFHVDFPYLFHLKTSENLGS